MHITFILLNSCYQDILDDNSILQCQPIRSQMAPTGSNEGLPLESRLMAVVNRYEAQVTAGEGHSEIGIDNEQLVYLTDRLSRLPTIKDPEMWRIRVQVSLWDSIATSDIDRVF